MKRLLMVAVGNRRNPMNCRERANFSGISVKLQWNTRRAPLGLDVTSGCKESQTIG